MKTESKQTISKSNRQLLNTISEENFVDMDALKILGAIIEQPSIKSNKENISDNMATDNKAKVEKPVNKVLVNGCLYEEVYDPETEEAGFAFYDPTDNQLKIVPYVDVGNDRNIPIVDKFVRHKVVFLPTTIQQYESEAQLLEEIQSFIHKYLDIPEAYEKLCTWTIVTYWLFDKLNIMIPYIRALGDTGCGKSRLLDVVGGISYRYMPVGGSMTPAILYRVAEKWKGTMIIDEADWKDTDEYSEVIKILNCNQPNRPILRCSGVNYDDIEAFDPFCPRILATRRNFSDIATESRMLTIQMKETSRQDIAIVLDDEFYNKQLELRNKLLVYRLKNWSRVNSSIKPNIDFAGIEPRSQQIIYPLAIVFNHNQNILDELAKITKERQGELIKDRSSTEDGVIANAYLELFDRGNINITPTDIVTLLKTKGQEISPQSIGHCMRSLGFKTTVRNVGGESKRCYNPDQELIERLRRRYSLKSLRLPTNEEEKLQRLQTLRPGILRLLENLFGGRRV
jgi:energy-coupling factor transporter ATP-binding protein EcfA2